MKHIILFLISTLAFSSMAGVKLNCFRALLATGHTGSVDRHLFILEQTKLNCFDMENKEEYHVSFLGFGPGVRGSLVTNMEINCPMTSDPEGIYLAAKVTASCMLGATGGLCLGLKGPCTMSGLNVFDLGFGASLGGIEIRHGHNEEYSRSEGQ